MILRRSGGSENIPMHCTNEARPAERERFAPPVQANVLKCLAARQGNS